MIKYKCLLTVMTIILSNLSIAQVEKRSYHVDKELTPREHTLDFEHLKLEVSFVPEQKLVKGKVHEKFTVLRQKVDSVFLDGIRMTFKEVKVDGKEARYRKTTKGIFIYFDQTLRWNTTHSLSIEYEANPKRGIYFIGWDDKSGRSKKQIWTQGQGIDNRHWIPMFDEKNDKLITELIVEFDEEYEVLSNGVKLKEKKAGEGKKQWHYKISKPHATYLIMLGIGKYDIKETKSKSGVPMLFYYYQGQEDQLEPTYKYSVEMFDFFEEEIGVPYPWKVYSQIPVQNFMYGAMENTTATIFGDFYLVDERGYLDRNYVRVNAHELAHQWFGDMVTARSSAHHWLQESFATHYDMMYQGEVFGVDHFDWKRRDYNNQAVKETKKNLYPIAHSKGGTVRHYPKGALVLQMLKYVVGKEQYNAAVKYYLEKHAYGNVDSDNLLFSFHERLGLSLNWFWEEWVYKGGEPKYDVLFQTFGDRAQFNVKQTHNRNNLVGLFKMPIQFEIHFKDGSKVSRKEWIEEESELLEFDTKGKEISYVLFDPNSEVLKSVNFNKSIEMLKAQAAKAEFMIDRYDAIKALSSHNFEGKEDFLLERYKEEGFHAIKSEIIQQILPNLDANAEKLMLLGLQDPSADVRKAILRNTLRIPPNMEGEYRKLLNDSSYQVIQSALELLSFYYPQNIGEYLDLTRTLKGSRSHNIRISWLKIAYQDEGKEEYLDELIDKASNSFEFMTRINAMNALKELNAINETGIANAMDASFSFNSRLRRTAGQTIDHFFAQAAYKKMILNYVASQNWTDSEFKRVSKYLAL